MAKFLIVEARFYDAINDQLLDGARTALEEAGHEHETITVPGALEIPGAIALALDSGRYDGFVAIGCVIRGETSHYDYVCSESARKLQDLACEHTLALGYGILTCETKEQAWVRAAVDQKNKGRDAAEACLAMLEVKRRFHLFPR